ncbi:DMT family transporter [Breoghania sp.]|uniref:DMT family transporter n=1 Tax=Breoghania sp. TaxID=2065378 RepID=UPI002AA94620|nr:DMT family transporter [Breoghania sp.]
MSATTSGSLPKVALLCAVFFWASSFIAMKSAVLVLDPGKIVFMRMMIASIGFLLLYRLWGNFRYQKGDWIYLAVMSICEPGIYFFLESQALRLTTAGSAATINALQPPIVALLAWVLLRERPRFWTLGGFALCIVGAVGLSLGSQSTDYAPMPWLGNLLEFGAMAASGVYVILLKKLSDRYSPFFLTALQSFTGAVLFFPLVFVGSPLSFDVPLNSALAIVYLATFVTFGGYFLYNWGIAKTSAIEASIFLNLIPVFGLLLAFLYLAETPTPLQGLMVALIIFGVFICELGPKYLRSPFPITLVSKTPNS